LVLAPLEKRFLPKIVSASTWKNFSDLASFQIERREEGWRIAPQMKFPIVGKKGKSDYIGKRIDVAQLSIEGTRAGGIGTRILLWQGSRTSRLSEGNGPQNYTIFSRKVLEFTAYVALSQLGMETLSEEGNLTHY
jgi:hypothetical protein